MVDDDQKTQLILDILVSANSDKPWMTAKGIAGELKEKIHIPSEEIQKLLLDHISKAWQENESPKIRYSNLPSKKTLQVLWGGSLATESWHAFAQAFSSHRSNRRTAIWN